MPLSAVRNLVAALLLAAPGTAMPQGLEVPAAGPTGSRWAFVDVPLGPQGGTLVDLVDLVRGQVVAAPPADGAPFLAVGEASFAGAAELYAVPRSDAASPLGPSRWLGRSAARDAELITRLDKREEGDQLLWQRGADWGYLRLVERGPLGLRLEVATAPDGADLLAREPAVLEVDGGPEGFTLRFDDPGRGSGPWLIERRIVAPDTTFEIVGRCDAAPYFDSEAPLDRLVEWRVSRADEPRAFGATARAVRVVQPGEWPLPLRIGSRIDLLSGRVDGAHAHIEVTQLAPPTVVVQPLGKTLLLNLPRPGAWRLPARLSFDPAYEGKLRAFALGTELGALTPEGVIVRLELRREDDGSMSLLRQAALQGLAFAPRPPHLRAFELDSEQLVVRADDLEAEVEHQDSIALVLERELELGRGDYEILDEGAPGVRMLTVPFARFGPGSSTGSDADSSAPRDSLSHAARRPLPNAALPPPVIAALPSPLTAALPSPLTAALPSPLIAALRASPEELSAALRRAPLVRVRVRQRYAFGPQSFTTPPEALLLIADEGTATRAAWMEVAVLGLDAHAWSDRTAARELLVAFGAAAFPRLLELIESGSPEARVVAREVLLEARAPDGGGPLALLRAEAQRAGLVTPMPEGLLAATPAARAHAMVRALARMDSEAQRWVALSARCDEDTGVRGFADMLVALEERNLGPGPIQGGALAALQPAAARAPTGSTGDRRGATLGILGAEATLPPDARSLARFLEDSPWRADRELGPVLGMLGARLARAARQPTAGIIVPDYDRDTVDLVLRLAQRFVQNRDERLLIAALGLLGDGAGGDWELALAGWRSAVRARAHDRQAGNFEREQHELRVEPGRAPTAGDLEALLGELRQAGASYVDVWLPRVAFAPIDDPAGRFVDLDIEGLRLMSAPRSDAPSGDRSEPRPGPTRATLTFGLRVTRTRDVVLDDLCVEHKASAALMVFEGGHVVARNTELRGLGQGIQAQDSDLELFGAHVADLAADRPGQWSVRHFGRGRLVAEGSLFTGGSVYVGDYAEPYFERCVFDAGDRPVLQAQREGKPIVRECLMRSTGMGLVNVSGGCLAGVVLDVARDPFGPRSEGLGVDPRWFVLIGAGQRVPSSLVLARSPLEPE